MEGTSPRDEKWKNCWGKAHKMCNILQSKRTKRQGPTKKKREVSGIKEYMGKGSGKLEPTVSPLPPGRAFTFHW